LLEKKFGGKQRPLLPRRTVRGGKKWSRSRAQIDARKFVVFALKTHFKRAKIVVAGLWQE
jgi:hypothetical protein